MTSERKIAANRINGRKSRGPRTAAGKARSSLNAFQHGLAAITHRDPAFFVETEQIARAICGDTDNPLLVGVAIKIAESELWLRCTRAQRIALIERLRDATAVPLVKGDNRIPLAKAKSHQIRLAWAELRKMKSMLASTAGERSPKSAEWQVYEAEFPFDCWTDEELDALERLPRQVPESAPPEERDEVDAVREALPDLQRLARYERRAWSRRKRAIREFIAAKTSDSLPSGTLE